MKTITRTTHTIDATGQAVGRVATQAAVFLNGKNKPDFERHIDTGDAVVIINASKVKFTGSKLVQKDYMHHTNYPGGLKKVSMKKVFENDPADVIRRAIYGMLPKNSHRNEMTKRLTITA